MTFGTVFRYLDKEYVYLAETPEAIYAARILNHIETKRVAGLYEKQVAKNMPNIDRMPIYSYVILETQALKDRAASFHRTDSSSFTNILTPLNITLTKEDLRKIKDEITKDGCVSIRLRDLIKDIRI